MKNVLVTIIIMLFFLNFIEAESFDKNFFRNSTDTVLNAIKEKNLKKIKKIIGDNISIGIIKKNELKKLSDSLLDDKITIEDYLRKITGHNIFLFIQNYKILRYKIILIDRESKYSGSGIYFVKVKIDYIFKGKIFKNIDLELDFKKENNKFKLIGFII